MNFIKKSLSAVALASLLAPCLIQSAHANLALNGGFESTTGGASGQLGYNGFNATSWSVPAPSGSYTFLYESGKADGPGSSGQYGSVQLWGPDNGSNNGLTASSPAGGNFIAQDSAFQQGAIKQTISGLTVGAQYSVSFYYAAAQQYGFNGATFGHWDVSFGTETHSTSTLNIPNHGFSGWLSQTFNYTATSTSQVLSFFADGGPVGVPPFMLLDGVTVVPEPSTMIGGGLLALPVFFGFLRARRKN
jgi:hypothetical protein